MQAPQATGINTRMGLTEWLLLSVLSVIWGGSFFFIGVIVRELPPLTIVSLRVGLAALVLWGVVLALGIPLPRDPAAWRAMALMGLVTNVIPFSMLVWGQTLIPGGLASILNATTPLFTVILAAWLLPDERITPLKFAGVVVGFIGAVIVIGPESLAGLGAELLPQLACIAAGIFYALGGVYGRRFKAMGIHPLVTAAGIVSASALILTPVALIFERPWQLPFPSVPACLSILGMAVISTAVAYLFYFRLLDTAGATNLMLVTLLIPVSAILLGWLFLGERLAAADFIGMAVIGLGLLVIDGRLPGRLGVPGS